MRSEPFINLAEKLTEKEGLYNNPIFLTKEDWPKLLKPISRELLAKMVEVYSHDQALADHIRNDASFDCVFPTSSVISQMKIKFAVCADKSSVPVYDFYCGDTAEKAVRLLPYYKGIGVWFPGRMTIEQLNI